MDVINLENKFATFSDYWNPKIIAELNGQHVKLAKFKGEFVRHSHEKEDELFFVVKGRLLIRFCDKDTWIEEGEMIVIPAGTEHQPIAPEEVSVMLFEPQSTLNTGDASDPRTRHHLEKI